MMSLKSVHGAYLPVALVVVVVSGGFAAACGGSRQAALVPEPAAKPPAPAAPAVASAPAPPAERVIALEVDRGAARGPDVTGIAPGHPIGMITVHQGDAVTLRWTSKSAALLHLHGYDLHASVPAGGSADMHLVADKTGKFEIEPHGDSSHLPGPIVYLVVTPR